MITKKDRQLLIQDMKEVFATRDDIARELKPIKKELRLLNKRSKETISYFDRVITYHDKRLVQLEKHTGVKPPPYIPHYPSAN